MIAIFTIYTILNVIWCLLLTSNISVNYVHIFVNYYLTIQLLLLLSNLLFSELNKVFHYYYYYYYYYVLQSFHNHVLTTDIKQLHKDSATKLTLTITDLQANNSNKLTITQNLQDTCLVWAWMKWGHCKNVHINTSIVQIIKIELIHSEHLRQLKLPGRWQPRNERTHVNNPFFISNMTIMMMM